MLDHEIKKDLSLAEALATVSIRMVFSGPADDILKEQCSEQDEIERILLSLAVAHIAMATVAVKFNLTVSDSRKIEILDHLWETFAEKMGKQSQHFSVRKYIVASKEVNLVEKRYGCSEFITTMARLLRLIFDPRLMEYEAALSEGLLKAKGVEGKKINPFQKMIKTMAMHVYGYDNDVKNSPLIKLPSLMFASLQSMMSVCEGYS